MVADCRLLGFRTVAPTRTAPPILPPLSGCSFTPPTSAKLEANR